MNIYHQTRSFLMDLPVFKSWSEMQQVLESTVSKKPRHWRLPLLGCEAVGGRIEHAIPALAAMACLQISIILVDDMLDADPRGIYHSIGMPETANLAIAFQAAGSDVMASGTNKSANKMVALASISQMMATTALGQYLDVQNATSEGDYWRIVRTKSSPFFSTALLVGALQGGDLGKSVAQIKQFGELYGEMIQIHDDLNDAMATPASPDWTQGCSSLPILYTKVVDHPYKARFLDLLPSITVPAALTEAQTILIQSGAISYCMDQLLRRYQSARRILEVMSLPKKEGLEDLLEDIVKPIEKLFATTGITRSMTHLPPPNPTD